MALYNVVISAQEKNEDDQLFLIKQFAPLLRKYAYKLNVEDAYEILLLDFYQLLVTMDLGSMRDVSDGSLVKYFEKSVYNSYLKHTKERIVDGRYFLLIDDLSDSQRFFIQNETAVCDDYFEVEFNNSFSFLTLKEICVLKSIYIDGYSAADLATRLGVSRQNINQIKIKALHKVKEYLM